MSRSARWSWLLSHALLGALALFVCHALLFKLYRGAPLALGGWLALAFVLIYANREMARGIAAADRTRLQRAWASLDGVGLAFVLFFFALLLAFDSGNLRATADGREYFVQLRSLVIDGDLDFANDNALFRTHTPHIFPFGSAVLWLPFFVAAHLWIGLLALFGDETVRNGLSNPYQMAVGLGTLCYAFAGLLLAYRIARDYYPRRIAAAATMFVSAASFIVWYTALESSYSHGNSLFSVTLFLFVWYRTREERTWRGWAALGLAGGLMFMVRWQNGMFLLFALVDGLAETARTLASRGRAPVSEGAAAATGWHRLLGHGVALAAGLALAVWPQLLFWKVVNGGWFALPHAQAGQQWWGDSLVLDVLFSSNHGLLAWHPILFLALLGVPAFLRRDFRFGALLTVLFAAQVYINGASSMWWGGHAFGGRRFASCALLFVLGLAALLQWTHRRPAVATGAVLVVLLLGNVSLVLDVQQGRLPTSQGVALDQMLAGAYRRVGNPFSYPAQWLFGRRYGLDAWQYDQLGLRMYNNLAIDVGGDNDARFLGYGWGGAEGSRDASFRWATGEDAIVVVPLKADLFTRPGEPQEQADYTVRFRALPFLWDGAPQQSVELWVNGRLAGRQLLVDQARDYTIEVPRELLGRNLNVFRFRHAYARSPREVIGGDDARTLAARYARIEFLRRPR